MPATMLMPKILYGTAWKKERTADLVVKAVLAGFRGIDTACQPKHYQSVRKGSKRPWFLSHAAEALPFFQRRTRRPSSRGTFIQTFYPSIVAMGSDEIHSAGRARHVEAITLRSHQLDRDSGQELRANESASTGIGIPGWTIVT